MFNLEQIRWIEDKVLNKITPANATLQLLEKGHPVNYRLVKASCAALKELEEIIRGLHVNL